MNRLWSLALAALLLTGRVAQSTPPVTTSPPQQTQLTTDPMPPSVSPLERIQPLPRYRPACPIRLGGVYTLDLASDRVAMENSASRGTQLSAANQQWIRENCDVIALDASTVRPDTFRRMIAAQVKHITLTPLLFVYASSLYEQPNHKGSVGGWQPAMTDWTLRAVNNQETPHPDTGGHWMDFDSPQWATHWTNKVLWLARNLGAQGVVAAELPISNTFVPNRLKKYKTQADRMEATTRWLTAVRAKGRYLLIPSALGFDELAGHTTLPTPPFAEEPELKGRLWDEYYPLTDGAWAEGWVEPYWAPAPLPESIWEMHVEAADRAARNDQVFIAAAAYRNDAELEYALASYLLIAKREGRVVFQPMPVLSGHRVDAGFSLAMLKAELARRKSYFNVPLGVGMQERHLVRVEGGNVWRREFAFGVVYVNSSDTHTLKLHMAGPMRRVNGEKVREVTLPPHSGAILMYI